MTPDIPALKRAIDAYIEVVGADVPVLADAYPKPGVPRITAADLRSLIEAYEQTRDLIERIHANVKVDWQGYPYYEVEGFLS